MSFYMEILAFLKDQSGVDSFEIIYLWPNYDFKLDYTWFYITSSPQVVHFCLFTLKFERIMELSDKNNETFDKS